MADSRKAELSDFFKPKQPDAGLEASREYFKKCLGREELSHLFPGKEITYIQINYIEHREYRRDDYISNLDGMTLMTLEFSDGTKQSVKWKDPKIEKSNINGAALDVTKKQF